MEKRTCSSGLKHFVYWSTAFWTTCRSNFEIQSSPFGVCSFKRSGTRTRNEIKALQGDFHQTQARKPGARPRPRVHAPQDWHPGEDQDALLRNVNGFSVPSPELISKPPQTYCRKLKARRDEESPAPGEDQERDCEDKGRETGVRRAR